MRQTLSDHLIGTANLAREFCQRFGAGDIGYYLGLWHDVGKYSDEFQEYLRLCEADPDPPRRGPDHKAAGTQIAVDSLGALAMVVQGHHGGLEDINIFRAWFHQKGDRPDVRTAISRARDEIEGLVPSRRPQPPEWVARDRLAADLFIRMVYSALVDADSLDTEHHFTPSASKARIPQRRAGDLLERFVSGRESLLDSREPSPIDGIRNEIFDSCWQAADGQRGFYRLTVPTGGGKTLSAMAFALRHAAIHNMERVVVAVPFLSITEQTADVYRRVFGDVGAVLEHHSGEHGDTDTDSHTGNAVWQRLAAENWDAPVMVTTTVQLLDSLFSRKRGRLRKVHRLANSVIILDEVQALPVSYLDPILNVLRDLVEDYGATVVLSSATQPTFDVIASFRQVDAVEIVPRHREHFEELRRVDYEVRRAPVAWSVIAEELASEKQWLTIVNTKKDAVALMEELDEVDVLHLSTNLCGAHRHDVLQDVQGRLERGESCRLVSTQVVEAGVDLDFPLVFRAVGPLDSIVQAAGRCNRNGALGSRGRLVVFDPLDGHSPTGFYRTATTQSRAALGRGEDPNDPETLRSYFAMAYPLAEHDARGIQENRRRKLFRTVSDQFHLIAEDSYDVIVEYGAGDERAERAELIGRVREGRGPARDSIRKLRRYVVSVPARVVDELRRERLVDELLTGLAVWLGGYDPVTGLAIDQHKFELVY